MKIGKTSSNRWITLPDDFVTQTCAILARKGAGKTYTGMSMAEGLLSIHHQVVILDPLDVWWGLKSSADGKSPGFPIIVFGGDHADLKLDVEMAGRVVDLLVEDGLSMVLSLDHFSKSDQRKFVTAFCEALYRKKTPQKYRTAMHLFIDEADSFAPQRIMKGSERMFGSVDTLVRRGRTRGIGVTMITQRPATLHKDVLTQAELLIGMQMTAPQDRKALLEWVEAHDTEGRRKEFMESLAGLQTGEAWIWSPSWLNVFVRVKIRKRDTFDSSATPKAGKKPKVPKKTADIDLDAIQARFADVIESAQKESPVYWQQQLRDAQKAYDKLRAQMQANVLEIDMVEVNKAVTEAIAKRDAEWISRVRAMVDQAKIASDFMANTHRQVDEILGVAETVASGEGLKDVPALKISTSGARTGRFKSDKPNTSLPGKPVYNPKDWKIRPVRPEVRAANTSARIPPASFGNGEDLKKSHKKILTVLAQRGKPSTKKLVAMWAGYSVSSGGFAQALADLRAAARIQGTAGALEATTDGLMALGSYDPLPTGAGLISYWEQRLGNGAKSKIFSILAGAYPQALTKAELAEEGGYSPTSGGFAQALADLRGLELISRGSDPRLSDELFEL